jgi:addiction module RelE/StbE family toxin
MEYSVIYLPEAKNNLDDIDEYLNQFYPSTAANFFQNLEDKISLLKTMPLMYAEYIHNKKYRRCIVDDYLVFYVVDEEKKS